MKTLGLIILLSFFGFALPVQKTRAQIPIADIIKAGITKVIVAVDLKIQRLQNKTIWLQSAQKTVENTMSKLRLDEIKDWVQKQKTLYEEYFDELSKVKSAIVYYQRVKEIISQETQIVHEYKSALALFKQDKNFTEDELEYMTSIYAGIVEESGRNLDQLFLVINSFVTQMTDEKRLAIIDGVSKQVEENLMDLKDFNEQNKLISLQRSFESGDIDYVRKLYGL